MIHFFYVFLTQLKAYANLGVENGQRQQFWTISERQGMVNIFFILLLVTPIISRGLVDQGKAMERKKVA